METLPTSPDPSQSRRRTFIACFEGTNSSRSKIEHRRVSLERRCIPSPQQLTTSIAPSVSQTYAYTTAASLPSEDQRSTNARHNIIEDASLVRIGPKKSFKIGDSQSVWDFYHRQFKCIQQIACREIAKAFVKVIAPKKQTTNPYTKGEESAPDWWPRQSRHIEPDHLLREGLSLV